MRVVRFDLRVSSAAGADARIADRAVPAARRRAAVLARVARPASDRVARANT